MNFSDFSFQVAKIKNLPLPGSSSHYKMAPKTRIEQLKALKPLNNKPKKAAVVALFYPSEEGMTNLLLILRNTYPGIHSNQIGLPGGKVENSDKDLLFTALRETNEEVGVAPEKVEIVKSLSELYIPPSNFEVKPFLGLYDKKGAFIRQQEEVKALIEVPLSDFMNDDNLILEVLTTSYADKMEVPAFKLKGYTVWGATAMMLSEIKDLFKQVL